MQRVDKVYSTRYEVKRSIFISHLLPIEEFDSLYKKLKIDHPKATHIIYAYRKLNEFDQIVENQTDDNEPKGCAGPPTLAVLRGEELINTAILTVRYFGGIKLGVGGMIRGYSSAAVEVIKEAELLPYEKKFPVKFEIPYSLVNRYEHYFNHEAISFPNREFNATTVTWVVDMTEDEIEKFEEFKKGL